MDGFCIMDKREKNVKERIVKAIISLSSRKNWDEITITDIINESKVARATFYRNFNNIDELIEYGIEQFRINYWENAPKQYKTFLCEKMLEYTFYFFKKNKDLILSFSQFGKSNAILDIITEGMLLSFGDMPANSILKYKLYFYSGALYNTMINWIKNGAKETAKEMAKAFLEFSVPSKNLLYQLPISNN